MKLQLLPCLQNAVGMGKEINCLVCLLKYDKGQQVLLLFIAPAKIIWVMALN